MGHVKGFSVAAFLTEVTQARQRVWPHGSTRGSRDPVTYTSEQTEQVTASSILVENRSDKVDDHNNNHKNESVSSRVITMMIIVIILMIVMTIK